MARPHYLGEPVAMARLSLILTAMIVFAAIWFFWPFAGQKNVVRVDAPPSGKQAGELFTKPLPKDALPKDALSKNALPDWAKFNEKEPGQAKPDTKTAVPGKASPLEPAKPTAALQAKRFYRAVVRDGGSLETDGVTITLGGIDVKGLTGQCKDTKGQDWPCGRYARAALIRLIRGRAVLCQVPVSGEHKALTARCSVGGKDLSLWMVRQGWAEPKASAKAELTTALDTARKRRLGIWR